MIEIKAYQCEHCFRKVLSSKSGIKAHEKKCFLNEETKSCATCGLLNNFGVRSCLAKVDITSKLKTQCEKWEPEDFPPMRL